MNSYIYTFLKVAKEIDACSADFLREIINHSSPYYDDPSKDPISMQIPMQEYQICKQ